MGQTLEEGRGGEEIITGTDVYNGRGVVEMVSVQGESEVSRTGPLFRLVK